MWFCKNCKDHKQARKKLDLYKLPDVLIVHLKRFSYTRYLREKVDTLVDFPITDLDLSSAVDCKEETQNAKYDLFAVSQHYGGLGTQQQQQEQFFKKNIMFATEYTPSFFVLLYAGGGHYTAVAQNILDNKWYKLDDSHVSEIVDAASLKREAVNEAAYVLFYKRQGVHGRSKIQVT